MDGLVVFDAKAPQRGGNGVPGGGEGHMGCEQGVAAHIDVGVIHAGQAEVGVDPIPEVDMVAAPVGIEGRLNIAVFSDLGEHLPEELRPLFLLQGPGGVVVIELFQAEKLFFQNGAVVGPVELPAVLQFPLIHGIFLSDARYYRDNRMSISA